MQNDMPRPDITSIQVAMPREVAPQADDYSEQPWITGFFKKPVADRVRVYTTGVEGDGQADLIHHGGADKAICVYSRLHYSYWHAVLGQELPWGAFGENVTVDGLDETSVCIGDRWRIGERVIVQVSQPRQPCWKLARRWQRKTLALEVQDSGKTGWYFRVLAEGIIAPGDTLTMIDRLHPTWTVANANRVMHRDKQDLKLATELFSIPELSQSWRATLEQRIDAGTTYDNT